MDPELGKKRNGALALVRSVALSGRKEKVFFVERDSPNQFACPLRITKCNTETYRTEKRPQQNNCIFGNFGDSPSPAATFILLLRLSWEHNFCGQFFS